MPSSNEVQYILNPIIKIILVLLHVFVIFVSAYCILFIRKINILLLHLLTLIIVFGLIVIYDGCLLRKYETIGGDLTCTVIGKKIFFLDNSMSDTNFEKLFVGIPIGLLLLKIILLVCGLDKYNDELENLKQMALTLKVKL